MILSTKLTERPRLGKLPVPYVAHWSAEEGTCYLSPEFLWSRHVLVCHQQRLGEGVPVLGQMSFMRQRECVLNERCQVCFARLVGRRYVFIGSVSHWLEERVPPLPPKFCGTRRVPLIDEPPVCATCAAVTARLCPGVRGQAAAGGAWYQLLAARPIASIVRPLGDPAKDAPFAPLAVDDFPPGGAVGYIRLACDRIAPWSPPAELAK